ncbi:MAG: formylmethanofuran dehydrogenase subunit E family protein, partial [Alistipes sp.]|nr:formylmethanofuran dehydrogenase subunit E family protein [Alistipes sp.]
ELHGHLGIYATIGVKMGIRAREYFAIGVDDMEVTPFAGSRPPVSCMNDGLQVGTGGTVGHGLITVAAVDAPRPEAVFRFKDKSIRLKLKPEYAARIRDDVQRGVALYGPDSEPYWQYIRQLALRYWAEFDRHELFDLTVEEPSDWADGAHPSGD